jgi:ATPase family associated with various cellular activities (AAA)
MKDFDKRFFFVPLLRNYFNPSRYEVLSPEDKLISFLMIMNTKIFPEIKSLIDSVEYFPSEEEHYPRLYRRSGEVDHSQKIRAILRDKLLHVERSEEVLRKVLLDLEETYEQSEFFRRMKFLREMFSLSDLDAEGVGALLVLHGLKKIYFSLPIFSEDYFSYGSGDQVFERSHLVKFLGQDEPLGDLIFTRESTMVMSGLIQTLALDRLMIGDNLLRYFQESLMEEGHLHGLQTPVGSSFPIDSFNLSLTQLDLLQSLIRNPSPAAIYFIGPPGVGKTALALSLARALGKEPLLVPPNKPERESGSSKKKVSLFVSSLITNPRTQVVIADECEDLIDTRWDFMRTHPTGQKEFVNNLLDRNRAKLIFIANHLSLDESTLRRFSLIIEFKKLDRTQRELMIRWTLLAQKTNFKLANIELDELVRQESLSQGIIALALRDAIQSSSEPEVQKNMFLALLRSRLEYFRIQKDQRIGLMPGEMHAQIQ